MSRTLTTKAARLQAISDLIERTPVRTQDELRSHLAAAGFEVTQATLSRDLDELRAIKVVVNGESVYAFSSTGNRQSLTAVDSAQLLARVCGEVMTAVAAAQNLVIVHTRPGAAHYFASALDRDVWREIVGSVAGDDTVMIACVDSTSAADVAAHLSKLAGGKLAAAEQDDRGGRRG